ncbi:unnamed protein product, partial [Polarella glacialis]
IPGAADGFSLAIYPGSFNPPSVAHVEIARVVMQMRTTRGIDAVWLDMAVHSGGSKAYVDTIIDERVNMSALAVEGVVPGAAATRIAPNLKDPLGFEYFEVIRALVSGRTGTSKGCITWVIGSDVVEGMKYWQEKARSQMMMVDEVAVILRSGQTSAQVQDLMDTITMISLAPEFANVSSTEIRREILSLKKLSLHPVLEYVFAHSRLLALHPQ